jgi:hypothetical protein
MVKTINDPNVQCFTSLIIGFPIPKSVVLLLSGLSQERQKQGQAKDGEHWPWEGAGRRNWYHPLHCSRATGIQVGLCFTRKTTSVSLGYSLVFKGTPSSQALGQSGFNPVILKKTASLIIFALLITLRFYEN